jgi:hypothetical protein
MASPLAEAAVEAIELDAFATDIPDLIYEGDYLYSLAKKRFTTVPVSNISAAGGVTRPSFRVNMRVQSGAAIAQGTGNGDSLGRGTGSQWAGMALSPVFFYSACEITYLARRATQGKERGKFMVQAQELKNSLKTAQQGLEGLLNSDGSGALDQIPTTATVNNGTGGAGPSFSSIVGLNVAVQFTDQQTIQVFPSVGGTSRGSFVISYVDGVSNTVYSSGALPAGTATGDFLMVAGSAGSAGSSLMGLRAYQVNSNTGTLNGLSRASFPGRLSTPVIDLAGAPVVQGTPARVTTQIGRALGSESEALNDLVCYTGPDQGAAVQNLMYSVQIVNAQEVKGDKSIDMAKKHFPATFGGHDLLIGWNALPGRMDWFCPNTWYIGEMIPLELYDFGGGVTVAPVPDISGGGYLTSSIFYYNAALNIANSNMRAGLYIKNCAQPAI